MTFAPEDNLLRMEPYTRDLQRIGVECLYRPYVSSIEQHLAERGAEYDLVLVFRVLAAERNLPAIRKHCSKAKFIFHAADLHHLREARQAEVTGSAELAQRAAAIKQRELAVVLAADATIVHSSAEKALLDAQPELQGTNKVFVFSWATEIPGTRASFADRDGLLFIGGFRHPPNEDAVLYFAREVFPLVRARLPHAKFRIVGSNPTPEVLALASEGIEVIGFMQDLGPLLDRCRLSVVPLRFGAGIKGKIGTSLSHGLPCVSTAVGTEGMNVSDGDGVLVADEASAFADAVVRLHEDAALWTAASRGGLAFVQRNFSMAAGVETLTSILTGIGIARTSFRADALYASMLAMEDGREMPFAMDWIDDPALIEYAAASRAEFQQRAECPRVRAAARLEIDIARRHADCESYTLPGFCRVCAGETEFLVDRLCGATEVEGIWHPNWRERLVCVKCRLNNRERAVAYAARAAVGRHRDRRAEVYFMEQVTPIYEWMTRNVPRAICTGSEHLGENVPPGAVIKGVRHENVEGPGFGDDRFDLIISNDVLEHVAEPDRALREAVRVLRPGGVLLLTGP